MVNILYSMTRETLNHTNKAGLTIFAKTFIRHKDSHIHTIKNVIISKQMDFYAVVNTETLKITPFDTSDEALDHVLDYFNSLGAHQTSLI